MEKEAYGRAVIDGLDGWVNELARPFVPPIVVNDEGRTRLEFASRVPAAVMVGKCIRAASGIKAALVLADGGYVAESASLLRMVSDFCTEVTAIGEGVNAGGELPAAVQTFVEQYFVPKPRTQEQFAAQERVRYVSREELMKAEVRLAAAANVDGEELRSVHRFLNLGLDAYVHGAHETALELWNPETQRFMAAGGLPPVRRDDFIVMVFLKLHEVVIAIEFTAAVVGEHNVFRASRETRHAMDTLSPWL